MHNDSKGFIFNERNRITMFPSLQKSFYQNKNIHRNNLQSSLDQKTYRMTSNQLIKGLVKQNANQITNLRTTFLKLNKDGKSNISKKIGNYQMIKEIGKGGFAQVYEVQDTKQNKFALKQYNLQEAMQCYQNQSNIGHYFFEHGKIRQSFLSDEGSEHLIRFVQKFKIGKFGYIVQQLSQLNLSKMLSDIQGIFYNNERIYEIKFKDFYKELYEKQYLKKIMTEISQAVLLINKTGFIHCDLKLQNIMLEFKEDLPVVKIIDFGSTFELQYGLPKITITPEYMPPELLIILQNGSLSYQILQKVDVWSIGCILLQIITGIPLWFRYKCKLEVKGKATVQLGIFALTGRQYHKIIKKQKQLCQNVHKLVFTHKRFEKYRPILKKILVFNHQKRISINQCIEMFENLSEN